MAEWTESAKKQFEAYLEQLKNSLDPEQIDINEVIDDIRRHVDEEINEKEIDIVAEDDIKIIINRLGPPREIETEKNPVNKSPDAQKFEPAKNPQKKYNSSFIMLFGIIVPAIALTLEVSFALCAESLLDPIPTIWHILLISLVPVSNLIVYILRDKAKEHTKYLLIMNGVAIGVSFYYTLLFLPIIPIGLFLLIVFIGILPLAPVLSFFGSLSTRRYLIFLSGNEKSKVKSYAMISAVMSFFFLLSLEVPSAITEIGLDMANSPFVNTRKTGIHLLRTYGDEQLLLRACYDRGMRSASIIGFVGTILVISEGNSTQNARNTFYRVTGVPFNTVPPPVFSLPRAKNAIETFDYDSDEGGDIVAGRLKGLSLAGSRLDTSLDADAALAYTEWTMVFKNDSHSMREARAQIVLPSDGVVSRLTLWINGEEREATFASRTKTKEAYKKVVSKKRDPVLVTTSGPDRIFIQCFPVPRYGEMKVRIGITSPLILRDKSKGTYQLPYFTERNFGISSDVKHSVWVESKQRLDSNVDTLQKEELEDEGYALRGLVEESNLSGSATFIYGYRNKDISQAWTVDDFNKDEYVTTQSVIDKKGNSFDRVVFVVDGSESMKGAAQQIMDSFKLLPENTEYLIQIASDESGVNKPGSIAWEALSREKLISQLENHVFIGGQDNVPALINAWDIAAQKKNSSIVWIHGPQPVYMHNVEEIIQRYDRRPGGPMIYELQASNGTNIVVNELDGLTKFVRVPRSGNMKQDLEWLIKSFDVSSASIAIQRERIKKTNIEKNKYTKRTSNHLSRMWAKNQIEEILKTPGEKSRKEALLMSVEYGLVTPVSGAVVLETKKQYKDAGLNPITSSQIPTIPEPEVIILILVTLVVLLSAVLIMKKRLSYQS
ncbi:MAG TPA: VIT domain-containing protein [bacterium]|nr:VIT domain-containing protein [bacterium]